MRNNLARKYFNLLVMISAGFLCNLSYSQEIGDIFTLDTIVGITDLPIKNINPNFNSKITSNKSFYIVHTFTRYKTDEFCFTLIDKTKKTYKHFISQSKELKNRIYSSEAHTIAANDNFIFVVYFNLLATFKIVKTNNAVNRIDFYKFFTIPESYNYLSANESNEIFGANFYNRSKNKHELNSLLHAYKLIDTNLINEWAITPRFKNIEFSYFSPNHWLSNSGKYIVSSQTTSYDLDVYNIEGKFKYRFNAKKVNWVEMDDKAIKKIRETIPSNFPGKLIDSLKRYNDKQISRIEGVWFINEDSLLVRYYLYDSLSKLKIRYFDLYHINDDSATLLVGNLVDGRFPVNINKIITKNNFDMLSWNHENLIANNEIVIVKNYAPISNFVGKPWREVKKEEEDFYEKNAPIFTLIIFKLNR